MEHIQFFICDVFCVEKNTGNQLAVFIDNGQLKQNQMQMMAAEINFSESTFINPNPNPDGSFNVRIFTPKAEIPFAGHPCLGTAYIIHNKLNNPLQNKIALKVQAGDISIKFEESIWWMEQIQPVFGKKFDTKFFAQMLQLSENEIETNSPIEEVSTGLPFTILQVKNMNVLKKAKLNLIVYDEFIKKAYGKGILLFSKEGYTSGQNISVRVFVPWLGIPEDPATGSANGCLAAYLLKNNIYNGSSIRITAGQGYEINRPSELYLQAAKENDNYSIFIGGKTNLVAEGKWMYN